jgi:hypothetical protein
MKSRYSTPPPGSPPWCRACPIAYTWSPRRSTGRRVRRTGSGRRAAM